MELRDDSMALMAIDSQESSVGDGNGLVAPTMMLSGHAGAVYSLAFDPTGELLASASYDRCILLWQTSGDCKNYNILKGHKNAVTQVKWCANRSNLVSCSADETLITWDANQGEFVRKFVHHNGIVNAVDVADSAPDLFASASDDKKVMLWDARHNGAPAATFAGSYAATSVALSPDGQRVYTGGVDGIIRGWDVRAGELKEPQPDTSPTSTPALTLYGCDHIVTGLALSPCGGRLLANAMDSRLRAFDVRAFCAAGPDRRLENTYRGGHHGAEKLLLRCAWSAEGEFVACGSADRNVHIWHSASEEQKYLLGGHKASVNDVQFHPKADIIASAGSDKQIYLGHLS